MVLQGNRKSLMQRKSYSIFHIILACFVRRSCFGKPAGDAARFFITVLRGYGNKPFLSDVHHKAVVREREKFIGNIAFPTEVLIITDAIKQVSNIVADKNQICYDLVVIISL